MKNGEKEYCGASKIKVNIQHNLVKKESRVFGRNHAAVDCIEILIQLTSLKSYFLKWLHYSGGGKVLAASGNEEFFFQISVLFIFFPAALCLYTVVNTGVQLAQQSYLYKQQGALGSN